jgi:hypothetical protein
MGVRSGRAVAGLAGIAVALSATACTSKAKPILPAPVASQSSSAAPTLAPTPTVAAAASVPAASVSASPSGPVLPAGCSALLPLGTLESILGFGILGQVNYLKAAPVPQSGRTGRVTCTYGTAPGAAAPTAPAAPTPTPTSTAKPTGKPTAKPTASPTPVPLVQVSYITYTDASTAAGRVQTTIEADGASATVSNVSVSGKAAYILIGPTSSELVMSDLARTIVVELSPTLVTSDKAPAALEGIAAAMLRFGVPAAASASPSAGGSA